MEVGRASVPILTLAAMKVTDPMMMWWPREESTGSRNRGHPKVWHKNRAGPRDLLLSVTLNYVGKTLN